MKLQSPASEPVHPHIFLTAFPIREKLPQAQRQETPCSLVYHRANTGNPGEPRTMQTQGKEGKDRAMDFFTRMEFLRQSWAFRGCLRNEGVLVLIFKKKGDVQSCTEG